MYARQQAALAELSQSALAGTDLPSLFSQAAALVAQTLGVEYSEILELLPDRSALLLRAGAGWQEGVVGHATVGLETSASSMFTALGTAPVMVEDWRTETRFTQPRLLRDHGVMCGLYTIIHGPDHPFGFLGASSSVRRTFTDDELHFLQAIANVLALAIERAQTNQRLEQRVAERMRELAGRARVAESLHEILNILNFNRSLDEILDYIIEQACRLFGTAAGAIYRLGPEATTLNIRAACGLGADDAALNLPVGWGAPGQAVLQRRPAKVADTSATPWSQSDGSQAPQLQAGLARLARRYRALLAVPLVVKGEVYGAITLYYREPREFSDEEVRMATALSDQAALAIENARLVTAAQGQAVLEERQRLARDLHDSVTQALYGVTLHAEAATRLLASGDVATASRYLRRLHDTAQEALEEMRLLIFELRPAVLEQEGLAAALQSRLDAVEGRVNLETKLVVEGDGQLPPPVEQALYRIAQESLNNALKHAHARSITVSLRQEMRAVMLEIADDGVGFDPATALAKGGLGLRGIEERVAQLGGRVTLQSAPGGGTRVQVEIGV